MAEKDAASSPHESDQPPRNQQRLAKKAEEAPRLSRDEGVPVELNVIVGPDAEVVQTGAFRPSTGPRHHRKNAMLRVTHMLTSPLKKKLEEMRSSKRQKKVN